MIFAILVLLGGTLLVRIALAVFRNVPHKVRSVISLAAAIAFAFWAWSLRESLSKNQVAGIEENALFYLFLLPLLLAIGIGFIFVTINFEDDGGNWHEYASIGNVSFGKDIDIGITIQIGAAIAIVTLVFLFILAFTKYLAFILYGIVQLYFFLRVFFSRVE